MIKIKTYFRVNSRFIPLKKFVDKVPDEDYIEGAIEIIINSKKILSRCHWDYIDQMWSYLWDGIEKLIKNESYSTYLPDQPTQVSFELINGDSVLVTVKNDFVNKAIIKKDIFISAMTTACCEFFLYLPNVAPSLNDYSNQMLKRINEQQN